jgi:hypothetical protein
VFDTKNTDPTAVPTTPAPKTNLASINHQVVLDRLPARVRRSFFVRGVAPETRRWFSRAPPIL